MVSRDLYQKPLRKNPSEEKPIKNRSVREPSPKISIEKGRPLATGCVDPRWSVTSAEKDRFGESFPAVSAVVG